MSRHVNSINSADTDFQQQIIIELQNIAQVISEGFVYLLLVMTAFYILRQTFHYKMDKNSSDMLDEKLDKTINVLDEKLQQY